jgi:PAS domain S-box-containing protein
MENSPTNPAFQALRTRAEQHQAVSASLPETASPEMQRLVQELQVHQIELQMQYDELLAAQAELETSRAQYFDLYEFAPIGYCTIDKVGTMLQLNLSLAQLLGTVRQRLLNRRLLLFVDRNEQAQFISFLARLWATPGERLTCELAMRHQDETPFFAQVEGIVTEANPVTGQPATGRLMLVDCTARRRATELLSASEARFRATFEQSRDGMLLLDGHHFVDVNDAGVWLLRRVNRRQVIGHHVSEFWPEHQPNGRRSLDMLTDCMARAQTQGWCRIEWMRLDSAGLPVWDEMSFNPVVAQGKPLLHAIWRDITERKRLQQADRDQQQALAEAVLAAEESEKRRIAESLHNGLAQQLYATKLSLNQLQTQQCRNDPKNFAEVYHKASQLLATAIGQTRTLSHELIPRTLQDFGLEVAIKDICNDYSIAPLRMRCSVQDVPAGLPPHLLLALYRMAQELANNIVKHAQATQAVLHVYVDGPSIVLRAEDNGVGFDQTRAVQSKGMGWQTLQDRVHLLKGTLELQHQHGTQVTILLPLPT